MKIINRKTSEIIPYEKNPRINNNAVDKTARSIKEFGFQQPIVVDPAGVVIAGHTRLKAAIKLGLDECPVIVADGLSDAQVKAYRIADNKTGELATWDNELLAVEIQDLIDMKYDIELTGFDASDFDLGEKGKTDDDEVPDVPDEPVTKLGDLWLLGDHKILCGDSTDVAQVSRLMDGQKADMVFTDPPYLLETKGGCKGEIGKSIRKYNQAIDFISNFNPSEFLKILPSVFNKKKLNAYIFCNKELLPDYLFWAKEFKISFNVLIWKKPNAVPIGDSHRPDIEYLLLFRKSAIWNNGLKDVNYSRVLDYGRESGLHPTMKPVSLIENEIKISSNAGSIIVDFYSGSGSTLIACEKTNRKCFGLEIDPHYCQVILQRWSDYTGKDPVREDGTKYKDLK